ncbi:antirestriction protein ArdA [Amycolatopsis sp. NBC_01488]|uniref:antirestriction protein ArdA n=1 Tax=Amycolatopsis sp. NBC_01488 TaxID=2903563 RepID=UPI002E2E0B05|nr:antirestriction protein ArdA [Amycolatopsis sp. NBC_01488]
MYHSNHSLDISSTTVNGDTNVEHLSTPQGGNFQNESTPPEHLTDEQLIHYGITEALREGRPIDHTTVRVIASQLHGGQRSPLYALASTGALTDGLRDELDAWREDNETGVEVEPWLDALDEYLDNRDDAAPVAGWHQLWPAQPERQDDEPDSRDEERPPYGPPADAMGRLAVSTSDQVEQSPEEAAACQALFERISAAGVRTLGEVAVVDTRDQDDLDDYPWTDAAAWSPTEVARHNFEERRYSVEELDVLFGAPPDNEIGTVSDLGWYGLVKHQDRPGGLILIQDEQGYRHVREALDDHALEVQWSAIETEYSTYHAERDAYEQANTEADASPSGHSPRIWVGSLADYNSGRLHGVWMDATLEPDELQAATQFMLRNGYTPDAEEWAIFDYEDFAGYSVGEYDSFDTVSRVARGLAQHGQAYTKWVEHVGIDSTELLTDEHFLDHYHGEWESAEEYVEHLLSETDAYDFMQFVPESIRHYVSVDVEAYARDMQSEGLLVEELHHGRVAVFWTR